MTNVTDSSSLPPKARGALAMSVTFDLGPLVGAVAI
jgi:hypothetical protein